MTAGYLMPSSARIEFPEYPVLRTLSTNRISGADGFADFSIRGESSSLDVLVLAVEPHARVGGRTFFKLLRGIEEQAISLYLSKVRALDVQNLRLERILPRLGYVKESERALTKKLPHGHQADFGSGGRG